MVYPAALPLRYWVTWGKNHSKHGHPKEHKTHQQHSITANSPQQNTDKRHMLLVLTKGSTRNRPPSGNNNKGNLVFLIPCFLISYVFSIVCLLYYVFADCGVCSCALIYHDFFDVSFLVRIIGSGFCDLVKFHSL